MLALQLYVQKLVSKFVLTEENNPRISVYITIVAKTLDTQRLPQYTLEWLDCFAHKNVIQHGVIYQHVIRAVG